MKTILLLLSFSPLVAVAQKLVATAPPKTYYVGHEKAFIYRTPADTVAGTSKFYFYPGEEVTIVGEFSPRWLITKRTGYLFLIPAKNLSTYRTDKESGSQPLLKVLDEKNGFREYRFGDDISKFPTMKKIEGTGNNLIYANPSDNLKIGEATLSEISYCFYKGKLNTIIIQTKGLLNSQQVREALEAQYGKGTQPNSYLENYFWLGDKVNMMYDEKSLTHDTNIVISSVALTAQQKTDEKQAAKKAASDL